MARWQRGLALTTSGRQVNDGPDRYGMNFAGQPAPDMLAWWPDLGRRTYTGQGQAAWTVSAVGDFIALGGEFPTINGANQQGLVRFAKTSVNPTTRVPRFQTRPARELIDTSASVVDRTVTITQQSAWDEDNEYLSYEVFRDYGTAAQVLVESRTVASTFWQLPGLTFTDSTAPDGDHDYRVRVSDGTGNAIWATRTPKVTVPSPVAGVMAQASWWLDSTASSTVFSDAGCTVPAQGAGASVGCWRSRNGASKAVTASTGRPVVGEPINGLAPVNFTTGTRLSGPDLFNGSLANATIFMVSRERKSSNSTLVNLNGSTLDNTRFSVHAPWGSNRTWYFDAGGCCSVNRSSSPAGVTLVGDPVVFTGWKDSAAGSNGFQLNGGPAYTSAGFSAAATDKGLSLGQAVGGSLADHDIAELLIFNRTLSSAERAEVQQYLDAKWGPLPPGVLSQASWWLDSTRSSTVFSDAGCTVPAQGAGASVGCWRSRNDASKAVTASTGRPVVGEPINGLAPVNFTTGRRLSGPDLFNGSLESATIFVVSRERRPSNNTLVNLNGSTLDATRFSVHAPWASNRTWYFDAGGCCSVNRVVSASGVTQIGDPVVFTGWKDAAARSNGFQLNGGPVYTSAGFSAAATGKGLSLGQPVNETLADHDIAELVVFNQTLTPSQRAQVQQYLAAKWGLA